MPLLLWTALLLFCHGLAVGGDFWTHPGDPEVLTNNDCGIITAVHGIPLLRRSFMSGSDAGLEVYIADRIQSGDELVVPEGGRLEWTSGSNMVVVLGPGTKIRLEGLRSFVTGESLPTTRLDMQLLEGELRVQVRLNTHAPEAVLVGLSGADVLVTRGDIGVRNGEVWRAVAIDGEGLARQRRGNTAGAPFAFVGGVGGDGEDMPSDADLRVIRSRLPFSFEQIRAALPPLPALSGDLEAP